MKLFQRRRPQKTTAGPTVSADKRYRAVVKTLMRNYRHDQAMELAVGGEFKALGLLEVATLKRFGLGDDAYLIDVGCGSGRLAQPLSQCFHGKYLGIDIEPNLVNFARQSVRDKDWQFEVTDGSDIPEKDETADMVCFFSVFTHLLHEQTYIYLREAKRVLKSGGKIIFSFLDFTVPLHWDIFESATGDAQAGHQPLTVFISKDAIGVWADHLGLKVDLVHDGDQANIPLPEPVVFDGGGVMKDLGTIGQSLCVLSK
jgi:SAM-dependent methyltransferase